MTKLEKGQAVSLGNAGASDDARPSMISVVIPNLNGAATLGFQLGALAHQTYKGRWEVIIADNGSTDDSVHIARRWKGRLPELRMIDASDHKGVSRARNEGALAAKGDFLAFCDSDDVATPEWLQAMADAARGHDVVGGWLDHTSLNDPATHHWNVSQPRDELPMALGFLPYAVGGNCGVRTSVFRTMQGWREDYIAGCDDVEFSWRASLAGFRVGYAPGAIMRVRYRGNLRSHARQHYRWGRAEAHLYRDFRRKGMPRSSTRKALVEWAWIIRHLLDSRQDQTRRGHWVRKAAHRWGRLGGSIKYRVRYL